MAAVTGEKMTENYGYLRMPTAGGSKTSGTGYEALRKLTTQSYYNASHAPLFFAFRQKSVRDCLKTLLTKSGIPAFRFEDEETDAE